MRKFIIALEVNLNDQEARSPERWLQSLIGSIKMKRIKSIKVQEVNEEIEQKLRSVGASIRRISE